MKVALLIAGYLRNYKESITFIEEEIINKYGNVDVYLHITKDEYTQDKYFNQIEESDVKHITNKLKPFSTIIEENTHYHADKKTNNTINHWNKLYKLNELKKINEEAIGEKYGLVIRYRLDLSIKTKNVFDSVIRNTISIPKDSKIDKIKLTDINDNYLCDALAFGDSEIMDEYFNIYNDLNRLIDIDGPVSETILYTYLNLSNIKYNLIDIDYSFILSKCNVFAICGDSGSGKSTLSNLLKNMFTDSFKLECDRYHKWERTHKNWNSTTHLNPNANFITKMNEDIFNLKVGNDIYQVDYDHHSGTFTEKQLINPTNNLIVCGLHSLYSGTQNMDEEMLYDLKIYMDTDDNLKKKWKIVRDVKERGYSIEKVLESIKKREADFNEYILPQKYGADLIIRFFTIEKIDFNDFNTENNLSLEISISKNFDIGDTLSSLRYRGFVYTLETDDSYNKITFIDYKDLDFFEPKSMIKTNTFYDYILYFILNLGFTN
jgi:uridine kinase